MKRCSAKKCWDVCVKQQWNSTLSSNTTPRLCCWRFLALVDLFLSLVSIIIQFIFLFSCLSCDFHQNNGKKNFSTGYPPWYIIIAISLSWLVLVIGFNNNSINTVSFSIYFPFYVIFIKKWQKKGLQFSAQGTHHGRLLKNFSEQLLQILKR